MSRKSTESLSVVPVTALPTRLEPPVNLPLEQKEVWRAVVATKPIDWFQADSAPVLTEYCRAVVMCDRLAALIEVAQPEELKDLLKMRDVESRRLSTLAVKMRLTQQSRYTPMASATADRKASGARPWEAKTA